MVFHYDINASHDAPRLTEAAFMSHAARDFPGHSPVTCVTGEEGDGAEGGVEVGAVGTGTVGGTGVTTGETVGKGAEGAVEVGAGTVVLSGNILLVLCLANSILLNSES